MSNTSFMKCLRETISGKQAEAMLTEKIRAKIKEQKRQRAIDSNEMKIEALQKERLANLQRIEASKARIADAEKILRDNQEDIAYCEDRNSHIDAYIKKLKESNRYLQSK
ncbi:MAG: hypothetical protein ACMUJM_12605 [bacterium]